MENVEENVSNFLSVETDYINLDGTSKKIFTDWLVELDGQSLRVKKLMDDIREEDFDKRCDLVLEWLRESFNLGLVEGKRLSNRN